MSGEMHLFIMLLGVFIAASGLGGTIITIAGRGRRDMMKTMSAQHQDMMSTIQRVDAEQENVRQQVAEAIAGIRQQVNDGISKLTTQITEVQFYIRDNFVREPHFQEIAAALRTSIQAMGDKLETRCLRLETDLRNKLDRPAP